MRSGSDVANIKSHATRNGNGWLLNGEKTFITGGMRSKWFVIAARTGGTGLGGVSLLSDGLYVAKHDGDTLHLLQIVFRMAEGGAMTFCTCIFICSTCLGSLFAFVCLPR